VTGGDTTEARGFLPVLTSTVQRRWTSSVFGIVAPGAVRRRPSDIARILTAAVLVGAAAVGASSLSVVEAGVYTIISALPDGLHGLFEVLYRLAAIVAGVVVVTALVARRPRLLLTLLLAGALGWAIGAALSGLVDISDALRDAGLEAGSRRPDFPVVPLSASAAVLLAARPFVTRPTRRMIGIVFWLSALAAVVLAEGLPVSVVATLALAWGSAAAAHLACGSPGGTPSVDQVATSLRELGVPVEGLRLDPVQSWGHTSFVSDGDDRLAVEVVGRDSTDARLFAKLWRFAWYKDAGPTVSLRRGQQVEHEALVLLLAARTGARVPELVAVGLAGARDDALLVVRDPPGTSFEEVGDGLTDAALDDTWANLADLHRADIAHGNLSATRIVVDEHGASGFIRLHQAETSAPEDHQALDDVQLLVTAADLVGVDRSLAAARRALGDEVVADRLPYLEPAALSSRARAHIDDLKDLVKELREAGSEQLRVETPKPAALRRFSLGGILLAAGFALGVYLLVAQLVGVAEMGDVFRGADWTWVGITAVIAQLPQLSQSVAMLGAVSATLPLRPVTIVQFANAFTGLVGGTAGNATLVIRFFQKQGLPPTVAVSSGVLNSMAGFAVQIVLVAFGLLVTGSSFVPSKDDSGLPSWLWWALAAVVIALALLLVIPKLRHRLHDLVAEQVRQAMDNVKGVLSTPRKALQLFGGNLTSQLLFAAALGAALHAYGESLPLLQLVVINSFASFVGGAAPVPGGMGVVEAGLIAGFTAAGIPQAEAVAATFTARTFTTYLPPIWGWFCFQYLRHHDYV
jgi:uncharacterized membrane protein YbhN (UPF0104 family)